MQDFRWNDPIELGGGANARQIKFADYYIKVISFLMLHLEATVYYAIELLHQIPAMSFYCVLT